MLLSELPFEPIGDIAAGPATGFTIAGADLATLYAPASAGVAAGAATGFTVAGTDLGQLFAGVGTVAALLTDWSQTVTASEFEFLPVPGTMSATAFMTFKVDGGYDTPYSAGRWLAPGATPSDYEIKATLVSGTLTNNGMVAFAQLNLNRTIALSVTRVTAGFTTDAAVVTVEIRKISNPAIAVSGVITLIASLEISP